jgi:uncharacterized membrane protein YraQ (UPF0718 family)
MCGPYKGENTPEDVPKEARLLDERNGLKERRPPRFEGFNGGFKFVLTVLISVIIGFMLPRLFDTGTQSGRVNQFMENSRDDIVVHEKRIRAVENEVAEGGRWTLENQMDYAAVQQRELARMQIQQTEQTATYQAALASIAGSLERLDKRMERIEKKIQ